MKLLITYYSLLTLVGCSTGKPNLQVEAPTTPQLKEPTVELKVKTIEEQIAEMIAVDPSKYPETPHWDADYEKIIKLSLEKFPVKMPCDPITTIKGIIQAESSFKKGTMYLESFGVYSIGLLQLSVEDERGYKCGFKTQADVKNPIHNLYCGIKIMNRLQTIHPMENFFEAQGHYWSSLRWDKYWKPRLVKGVMTPYNQGGVKRVLEYWKKNGCLVE